MKHPDNGLSSPELQQLVLELKTYFIQTVEALKSIDTSIRELKSDVSDRDVRIDDKLDQIDKDIAMLNESIKSIKETLRGLKTEIINDVLTQELLIKKHSRPNNNSQGTQGKALLGDFILKNWSKLAWILFVAALLLSVAFPSNFIKGLIKLIFRIH